MAGWESSPVFLLSSQVISAVFELILLETPVLSKALLLIFIIQYSQKRELLPSQAGRD